MKLLLSYLRPHWRLVALALLLAAVNQCFSLLDPLIFRHVIDEYATRFDQLLDARVPARRHACCSSRRSGVAFVSRVAKNFQDYFVNVVTQRLGAQLYSDGIRHSLELPYQLFEDQRSGETLGKLQKVRTDVEKLIAAAVNVLFQTLVGVVFVVHLRLQRALADRARLLRHRAAAGLAQLGALAAHQARAEGDRGRDDGARRARPRSRCATSSS